MEDIVGYLKADIFLIHETEGVLRGKWLKSKMPSTDSFEKKLRMETQTCMMNSNSSGHEKKQREQSVSFK